MTEARRSWHVGIVLVAATVLIYGVALRHGFVSIDDDIYVVDNPYVRSGFTVEGILHALTGRYDWNWHPLTWMSHTLDGQLFGLNPVGHHFTNLLLHATNVCLFFWLLLRMTGRRTPSAFAAALWTVHPLHVEVVAWISARKDLLSTALCLLTLHAYASYAAHRSRRSYALVALLFVAGLLSKPMLVTLPAVLLLLDIWPLRRLELPWTLREGGAATPRATSASLRGVLIEKLPLFALSIVSSIVTYRVQQGVGAMESAARISVPERFANAIVSYATYLEKLAWPSELGVLYVHPDLIGGIPLSAEHVFAAAILLVVLTVAILHSRRAYAVVGWLWFLGTLVPVIGLVQIGGQSRADRYTYLPFLGLYVAVAWGAAEVVTAARHRLAYARHAAWAVALGVLLALGTAARQQVATWRDSIALFRNAIGVNPNNVLARFSLAEELLSRGQLPAAIGQLQRIVAIDPHAAPAYNLLGISFARLGRVDKAVRSFERAVEEDPLNPEAHYNLALALVQQGNVHEAEAHLGRALTLAPDYRPASRALRRLISTVEPPSSSPSSTRSSEPNSHQEAAPRQSLPP